MELSKVWEIQMYIHSLKFISQEIHKSDTQIIISLSTCAISERCIEVLRKHRRESKGSGAVVGESFLREVTLARPAVDRGWGIRGEEE